MRQHVGANAMLVLLPCPDVWLCSFTNHGKPVTAESKQVSSIYDLFAEERNIHSPVFL